MNPVPFLREAWGYMPPRIRRGVLGMLFVAGVLVIVMFAYLAYSTGEIHRRFGVLPTVQDMNEQTEAITADMATKDDVNAVALGLSVYRDSLSRLRSHLDTTLIAPGLMAIVDLQQRMARVERGGVETRLAIEEQKRAGQQSTVQLIAQMSRQSSAESRAMERQQRKEQEERERDRALMQAIAKKLKIADPYETR
jgi:Na+-transporting methylmalonyl-CoA/oxaloacetate decarboxylase gamma subunit